MHFFKGRKVREKEKTFADSDHELYCSWQGASKLEPGCVSNPRDNRSGAFVVQQDRFIHSNHWSVTTMAQMGSSIQPKLLQISVMVLLLLLLGDFALAAAPSAADSVGTNLKMEKPAAQYQKPRRLLLPWMCRVGPGPACLEGMHVSCEVGGNKGCACSMIRLCHPEVSRCSMHHGENIIPCGF
ncbi:hypothetical protein O6H91_Y571300 [Diphasiastrum complanatum]|nr:hypothetical protein O6H91_Y571300 [Diphasiastrum complanatum]